MYFFISIFISPQPPLIGGLGGLPANGGRALLNFMEIKLHFSMAYCGNVLPRSFH